MLSELHLPNSVKVKHSRVIMEIFLVVDSQNNLIYCLILSAVLQQDCEEIRRCFGNGILKGEKKPKPQARTDCSILIKVHYILCDNEIQEKKKRYELGIQSSSSNCVLGVCNVVTEGCTEYIQKA